MGLLNAIFCDKDSPELGIVSCEQQLTEFKTPFLIRKGWSMPVAEFEALDYAGFIGLIQSGDWQPVTGSKQFTNNTPETTTQEYTGGVMSVVRNAKPLYQFDFDKGIRHHEALYSKNSFGRYDIAISDDQGTLILAYNADRTRVQGLSAGMVNAATYTPKSGDTDAFTAFTFQLINEAQFNRRIATYNIDQSGVDFNELPAVVGAAITGTATSALITVNVNAYNNTAYGIEALDADNFRVRNITTGTVVAIDSVDSVAGFPGKYTIDPTANLVAGQQIVVETFDEATGTIATVVGEDLIYKGVSQTITVAA